MTSERCPSRHSPPVPGAMFVVPYVVQCALQEGHVDLHTFESYSWPLTKKEAKRLARRTNQP